MSFSLSIIGVVIGMERPFVEIVENVGSVEVCAAIFSGRLLREVEVDLIFQSRNAMGKGAM